MARLPSIILVGTLLACADAGVVRIEAGRSDTVIVNNRETTPLSLRLVTAKGAVREATGAVFRLDRGDDIELSRDGHVKCGRSSDGELTATLGNLSTSLTLLCRPIASVRVPSTLRLAVGSAPRRLDIGAIGVAGESIDMLAGKAVVGDTQVAALVDGQVRAKARGITAVEVEAGACTVSIPIEVVETSARSDDLLPHQQYAETLSVSAGEIRSWRLSPGRYEISLFDANGAPRYLRLASHEMNCAALPRTEQQYSCIAQDRASIVVRHTEAAGRGRESKATLLVHRLGNPSGKSAGRPQLNGYRCPSVPW